MDINDIITIIYFIVPVMSFLFGLMESTEKQNDFGRLDGGYTGIHKTAGILILPPTLIQLIPVFLIDVSRAYIWKCIVFLLAIGILIFIVPRNFQTGLYSHKGIIQESTKKYQIICLKMFSFFIIGYMAYKLVISKWFELL